MTNYTITKISNDARIELHDTLNLTGAEVTINTLPPNTNVPFVHSHKENEEIYGILNGSGKIVIDGEDVILETGNFIKVKPQSQRQIFAGSSGITYICIQVKENSLANYTTTDAVIK